MPRRSSPPGRRSPRRRRSSRRRTTTRRSRTSSSDAKARRRSPEAVPDHQERGDRRLSDEARRPAGRGGAAGAEPAGLRVFVHAGQPEGDQRLRAARRTDVRPPRHVRRGGQRRRGRRRDGARAVARAAAARHRQRLEGAEPVAAARSDRRRRRRRGGRRRRRDRPSRRAASSASARCCCDTAATSRSRPTCSARRSWRAPATIRATLARMFETIEQRIEGRRRPAVDEQPPESRQPHRVHHEGGRSAHHRRGGRHQRVPADQGDVRVAAGGQDRWPSWRAASEPGGGTRRDRSARRASPCRRPSAQYSQRQRRRDFPGQRARATGRDLVVEQRDQGRAAERLRPAERPDRVHARRRVRRRQGGVARSAARRPTPGSRRSAQSNPELRLAGDQQSCGCRSAAALATPLVNPSPLGGAERIDALHDVSRGRQSVLLPHRRARERTPTLSARRSCASASRSG